MKQFNFRDYVFNQLFGYKFHVEDTYKDDEGKGILQRFIQVCSEYLDEEVTPQIDNCLDLLDLDKTPEIYIQYLWEYFGNIPYAYGALNSSTNYTHYQINQWLDPRYFLEVDYRNLLKYAIALYKIRCTSKFYTVLGRFYNLDITLEEDLGDVEKSFNDDFNLDFNTQGIEVSVRYDDPEVTYDDTYVYDQVESPCLKCIDMIARVTVYVDETPEDEEAYEINIKDSIINLLNKYLPVHIRELSQQSVILTIKINT